MTKTPPPDPLKPERYTLLLVDTPEPIEVTHDWATTFRRSDRPKQRIHGVMVGGRLLICETAEISHYYVLSHITEILDATEEYVLFKTDRNEVYKKGLIVKGGLEND